MVGRISYSLYELKSSGASQHSAVSKIRKGALLRWEGARGEVGYSDLHPWTHYGDPDVLTQLQSLKSEPLPLAQASLGFAQKDAGARRQLKSLLDGTEKIPNNALITDLSEETLGKIQDLQNKGYTVFKIKMGAAWQGPKEILKKIFEQKSIRVRLDFNSSLDFQSFRNFLKDLPTSSIEYVEDPFSYDEKLWSEARRLIPLALDFESEKISWDSDDPPACDVLIIKPARLNLVEVKKGIQKWQKSFTVTSSMDHAVGVAHALVTAKELKEEFPELLNVCGLQTLQYFSNRSYGDELKNTGPFVTHSSGYGIGFEDLLQQEKWVEL